MKLSTHQLEHLVHLVFDQWKANKVVTFKEDEAKVFQRAVRSLQEELEKESKLDQEVKTMLDDLERTHGGEFQRHKMAQMLKQKLAKEKKVVL